MRVRRIVATVPKLIYTGRLSVQIIGSRRRAHKRLTGTFIMPLVPSYGHKQVPYIINMQIAHTTITHGLKGGSALTCYFLKHNIAYFPFFVHEMHILSMIIIQSTQVLSKKIRAQIEVSGK